MRRLNPAAFNPWVFEHIDDYSRRLEVYYGGAGSGKSYGAAQKLLLKAMNSRRKVLAVRKVASTLRDSLFQLFLDLLCAAGLESGCTIHRSDMRIRLPNGSAFLFKGMDDREKIKSITGITDILIEEATELTEEDFLQLQLRLRPPDPFPQIYLLFNPVSRSNWVYPYFFLHPPAEARVVRTTYRDNRFLDPAYGRELEKLKTRSPAYYRIYALGEFASLEKRVYPQAVKRPVTKEEIQGAHFFCGLDFGYINDPSALVWGFYAPEKHRVMVTGEFVGENLLNDRLAAVIRERGLAKEVIVADCAEPKSIEEIRRLGVPRIRPSRKGPDSLLHGIQWLNQQEIVIDESCPVTWSEAEQYSWQRDGKTGGYINRPVDAFNHCLDALRYGLEREIRSSGVRGGVLKKGEGGLTAQDMHGNWNA